MKITLAAAKLHFSLIVLISIFGTPAAFGQSETPFSINTSPLPAPTGPVNDYAGVIDAATKAALDKRLIDYQKSTGVELAVAVVGTTGDRPIFDYSLAVARGWKIGSKEDDNPSALLFVAIEDRKYFTQVSRDLEDELPDGVVGSLQRQYLVPEFRKQNYAKGISDTLEAYIRTIDAKRSGVQTTPTPATGSRSEGTSSGLFTTFCCLAALLVIALIIWSNRSGGKKSGRDNDRWGGGFGGGASALPWIIGSAIANSASSSSSSSSDWGSGWSSGGSDWGGFGGGGDFGGGGSGGDW